MLYTSLTTTIFNNWNNKYMIKYLIFITLLFCVMTAQTTIKIYNQGRALVQEERKKKFSQIGKQTLLIPNIPHAAESSSINLFSDDIQFISKEYIYHPISVESLLNINIGQAIELVKYGEDGRITFSTTGKLISNVNTPVFEIDGKIVVNPPYSYRFSDIPDDIKDYPFLNCVVNSLSKNTDYNMTYITGGIDWEAEYNLYLTSDKNSEIEGWYSIRNDNKIAYENVDVTLVSGNVNFEYQRWNPEFTKHRATASMKRMGEGQSIQPETGETEEYFLFHLPEKMNLASKSQIRSKFVTENKLPYKNSYHISHSISRFHRNTPAHRNDLPVFVRLELLAEDVGNFQIPGGTYKVYEKNGENLTYIGTGSSGIAEGKDIIKLEIGKTHDILCTFTIQGYKINNNRGEADLDAVFDNRKDKSVSVEWIEQFSDGQWEITNSIIKYEKLDAYRALFTVDVPANSKKTVSFSVNIEKD